MVIVEIDRGRREGREKGCEGQGLDGLSDIRSQ